MPGQQSNRSPLAAWPSQTTSRAWSEIEKPSFPRGEEAGFFGCLGFSRGEEAKDQMIMYFEDHLCNLRRPVVRPITDTNQWPMSRIAGADKPLAGQLARLCDRLSDNQVKV